MILRYHLAISNPDGPGNTRTCYVTLSSPKVALAMAEYLAQEYVLINGRRVTVEAPRDHYNPEANSDSELTSCSLYIPLLKVADTTEFQAFLHTKVDGIKKMSFRELFSSFVCRIS